MIGRGFGYLIALTGLAALSTWFLLAVQSSLQGGQTQDTESPILTIEGFQASHMNERGQLQYVLTAPSLVQLPGEQGTVLDQPHFETFRDGRVQDWIISADQGWISADSSIIRLLQDVTAIRPELSGKLPIVITTRNVVVRPDEDVVETIEPVRMETPSGIVNATGFKSFLNNKQLELLSTVRGSYEPPKP
jgi:LPS export ABC transporter protein LptC